MARRSRRNHSPGFKAKVALAAVRRDRTLAAVVKPVAGHPNQIQDWKKPLLAKGEHVLGVGATATATHDQGQQKFHAKIGQLTMEKDCLASALGHGR